VAELLMIQRILPARFWGTIAQRCVLRVGWSKLYQIWRVHRKIIGSGSQCAFNFQILCCRASEKERIKGDRGRKSRPNFTLCTPV